MRKYLYPIFAFFIICTQTFAFEYKLYNPLTKETYNAYMMSVDSKKGDGSYYIGLYTYNLYCIVDKNIKTDRKGVKHGTCHPIDASSGIIQNVKKLPKWQEFKQGNFDIERSDIKVENASMYEIEFEP